MKQHADGCILPEHSSNPCIVHTETGVPHGTLAIVGSGVFLPAFRGLVELTQMETVLRVAPASTGLNFEYRWVHTKTGVIADQLRASNDPSEWHREAAMRGTLFTGWTKID